MDPLMSPAEFHDHQRRAELELRAQERQRQGCSTSLGPTDYQGIQNAKFTPSQQWEIYERQTNALHVRVQTALQDAEVIEGDNSPYSDILKALPWAIGAFLAVLVFVGLAFWAYVEWQPKLDLSYKGPAHYLKGVK